MAEATSAARAEVSQRQIITAGFASVVAWSFDLFDLFLLLFVASTIGPLFFRESAEVINAAAEGPPDPARMIAVMRRHGITPVRP